MPTLSLGCLDDLPPVMLRVLTFQVVETILHHLALAPAHAPLIPYPPFSWFSSLNQPPKATHYLPLLYRIARWAGDTPLGWGYVEPGARRKYGLVNQ